LAVASKNGKPGSLALRLVPKNLRELVKGAVDIPPELYVALFPTPRDCRDLRKGLLHPKTTFRTLVGTLADTGCDPNCATVGRRGEEIVVAKDQLALAHKMRTAARVEAAKCGCCHWESTVSCICAQTTASQVLAEAMISTLRGFCWLDGAPGWFWVQTARPSELRQRIARTLAVSQAMTLEDLRDALGEIRRLKSVSPLPVLRDYCARIPECRVVGNNVVATFAGTSSILENLSSE
jgi:hypothetical protein